MSFSNHSNKPTLLTYPFPAVPHNGGIRLNDSYQVPRTRFYINITRTAGRLRAADSGVIACMRTITPVVHIAVPTTNVCLQTHTNTAATHTEPDGNIRGV